MTKQQSKWNADAEAAMMGFTVAVESEEHLIHLVGYVLYTLSGQSHYDYEEKTKEAVDLIRAWERSAGRHMEIECSGGITIDTIRSYAEQGVDFVSVGALTHSYKSLDMSFKAVK